MLSFGRSGRIGDLFLSLALDGLLISARRHTFYHQTRDLSGEIARAVTTRVERYGEPTEQT